MGGPTLLKTMYDYDPVQVLTPRNRPTSSVSKAVSGRNTCLAARVEYMAYPRMCAIAETGWSKTEKDWEDFTCRLEHHFKRLDGLGVGYCKAFFDPYIEFHDDTPYNKVVTMSVDAPGADIHYTLDGSDPTEQSERYELPFVINRSQKVRAVAIRNGNRIGNIKEKIFRP